MRRVMIANCMFVLLIMTTNLSQKTSADCAKDILGMNNEIVVLSDNQTEADKARDTCSSSGGKLLEVQDQDIKNNLLELMKRKYTADPDLATVDMYLNPDIPFTKYRSSGGSNDTEDVTNWYRPDFGYLKRFMIVTASKDKFPQLARFCYFPERDYIPDNNDDRNCLRGWKGNFIFYNGTPGAQNVRSLSIRSLTNGGYTVRVALSSDVDLPESYGQYNDSQYDDTLFIPDRNVYVGARSEMGQTSWSWRNGTRITDANYSASDTGDCQQMTWPLTYDNGINLSPKACTVDKAYYACQFHFGINVSATDCNGTSLRISWTFFQLERIVGLVSDLVVQINISPMINSMDFPFNAAGANISGLSQRTEYQITAIVKHDNCPSLSVSTTARQTTGYGIPDPVVGAYVDNTSQPRECIIAWKFNSSDREILFYQVTANSGNLTSTQKMNTTSADELTNTNQTMRMAFDISTFDFNAAILFNIQAVSCGGKSVVKEITGSCMRKDCAVDMMVMKNQLFVLSDNETEANSAQEICSSSGGKLLELQDEQLKNDLIQLMKKKYTYDLATVYIYINPDNVAFTKYRSSGGHIDIENLADWIQPDFGNLTNFMIATRLKENFRQRGWFCYFDERDDIPHDRICGESWKKNFAFYNGTAGAPNVRSLSVRALRNEGLSARVVLSSDTVLPPSVEGYADHDLDHTIYIPDMNVYVGARSDIAQTSWFWSNGTMITDASYIASDDDVCQQMAWPLTYDNGINLSPKACTVDKAYYACQFQFAVNIQASDCNGTFLRVLWEDIGLEKIIGLVPGLTVQIEEPQSSLSMDIPLKNRQAILSDLTQRTNYLIKATIKSSDCPSLKVITITNKTTGYGIPDPVAEAHVANQTQPGSCVIAWEYDSSNRHIQFYQITGRNDKSSSLVMNVTNADGLSKGTGTQVAEYVFDISQFGFNETIQFEIQAVSCAGKSDKKQVFGNCKTPIEMNPVPPSTPVGAWVGIGIGILLIVALLIVGGLYFRRRKSPSDDKPVSLSETNHPVTPIVATESSHNPVQNLVESQDQSNPYINESIYANADTTPSKPISIKDFEETYLRECLTGFQSLQAQFKTIQTFSLENERTHNEAAKKENAKANRYKNIYPYDHARVLLKKGKYINASMIQGGNSVRNYIATQGPKRNTIGDFWELVWSQKSVVIVMLCNCTENGKKKCEEYWPESNEPLQSGSFKVNLRSEDNLEASVKRVLTVTNLETQEERTVVQFQFISWPDHGIPIATTGLVLLRRLVNEESQRTSHKSPIIVHCSAGAGRTGAYIAVDNAIEELEADGRVDIVNVVLRMRENRKDMVQTANQFVLVHKLVLENILLQETQYSVEEFMMLMAKRSWEEKVSQDFEFFMNKAITSPVFIHDKVLEENPYENQSLPVVASNQVKFADSQSKTRVIMDAHSIKNNHYSGAFIASSGPKRKNVNKFWDMIIDCNSRLVVALEPTDVDIYQQAEGSALEMGNKTISLSHTEDSELYLKRKFVITFSNNEQSPVDVTHLLLHCWNDNKPSVGHLATVIEKMKEFMKANEETTVLVYCRNGCSKTGVILALASLIEDVECGNNIDVFRTVKDLRDYRRGMIENLDDYKLCCELMRDYLDECYTA